MKVSKNRKQKEAVKRLQELGVLAEAIQLFSEQGKVHISMPPYGILYDLTREQEEMLKRFEAKRDALVYMVLKTDTPEGEMDSYMYVSDCQEEYANDLADLEKGVALAYVVNRKYPDYPEVGYIGVMPSKFGGVLRTN